MANVGFKLGLQSALDALLAQGTEANAVEGSFYLTSDTNRLYIGKADGSLKAVNAGVVTVANVAALPSITAQNQAAVAGQFYYATAENILCVYNGQSWTQINSVVKNTGLTNTVSVEDNVATIGTSVTQTGGSSVQDSFAIEGINGLTVTSTGSAADPKITIAGDKLTLGSSAADNKATISVTSTSGENNSAVTVLGGTNVTITKTGEDVVIASKDTKNQSLEVSNNDTSGFDIKVTDSDGAQISDTLDPVISYGGSNDLTAKFNAGTATLNVYSKTETDSIIESALRGFNAMEYKGTIGTTGSVGTSLPTNGVKNGYSYLLTEQLEHNDLAYPAGTLVIATGTEGGDGYIPSGSITWTFVTGASSDTTYVGKTVQGGIKLTDSHGSDVMQITAAAGNADIVVGSSSTDGTAKTQALTISHKTYSAVTPSPDASQPAAMTNKAASYSIPVIDSITLSNGHVTGIKTKTYTVKDTNASMKPITTSASASGKTATVTISTGLTQSDGASSDQSGSFGITSDSLTVSGSGSAVGINMVWGSF